MNYSYMHDIVHPTCNELITVRVKCGMNEKDMHGIAVKGCQKHILPSTQHTPSALLIDIVLTTVCSERTRK